MGAIRIPTLILCGDEDEPCLQPSLWLKQVLPNAGLALFAKTGHWIQWERAEEFNAITASFLLARYAPMEQA